MDIPDLDLISSSLSEDTLALKHSTSSEFDYLELIDKVDLVSTTFGSKPPSVPLREERLTLGVECVYKAKGVGWNGVKKNRKKHRRRNLARKQQKPLLPLPPLCVKQCGPFDDLFAEASESQNGPDVVPKGLTESTSRALSYEEYLEYLRRSNATRNEKIEYEYLELENTDESFECERTKKQRIFTRDLVIDDTFDSVTNTEDNLSDTTEKFQNEPAVASNPVSPLSELPAINCESEKDNKHESEDVNKNESDTMIDNLIKSSVAIEKSGMVPNCAAVEDTTMLRTDFKIIAKNKEEKKYAVAPIPDVSQKETSEEPEVLSHSRATSIMDSVNAGGKLMPVESIATASRPRNDVGLDRNSFKNSIDSNISLEQDDDDYKLSHAPTLPTANLLSVSTDREDERSGRPELPKKRSKVFNRQSSRELSRAIMKEHGFGDILPPSTDSENSTILESSTNEDKNDPVTEEDPLCPSTPSSIKRSRELRIDAQMQQFTDTVRKSDLENFKSKGSPKEDGQKKQGTLSQSVSIPSLGEKKKGGATVAKPSSMKVTASKVGTIHVKKGARSPPPSPPLQMQDKQDSPHQSQPTKAANDKSKKQHKIQDDKKPISRTADISHVKEAVRSPPASPTLQMQHGQQSSQQPSNFANNRSKKQCKVQEKRKNISRKADITHLKEALRSPPPPPPLQMKDDQVSAQNTLKPANDSSKKEHMIQEAKKPISRKAHITHVKEAATSPPPPPPLQVQKKKESSQQPVKPANNSSKKQYTIQNEKKQIISTSLLPSAPRIVDGKSNTLIRSTPPLVSGVSTLPSLCHDREPKEKQTLSLPAIDCSEHQDSIQDEIKTISTRQEPKEKQTLSLPAIDCSEHQDSIQDEKKTIIARLIPRASESGEQDECKAIQNISTVQKHHADLDTLEKPSSSDSVMTTSSSSHAVQRASDARPKLEEAQIEYQIPQSFSMNSCNSSMYSGENLATVSSGKAAELKLVSSNSTFGVDDLISNSFSFPSMKGSFSFKSERSIITNEDMEQTISYTISELGRIHSMIDENNLEDISCNSESTSGHDVLYFAKQSKTEIAALAQLIQRQINDEKRQGSFELSSPGRSENGSISSIVQTNSYDTNRSGWSLSKIKSVGSKSMGSSPSMDRLIHEVNDLCSQIEDRIDNIVLDTVREDSQRE